MASPDLNIGPNNGPIQPISTSRALTRVTPVSPRPITAPAASPLGRSGLNVRELLVVPDELVVRSKTPAVALDVGLEQARGAFVRGQPADALSMLDAVWEGAQRLETGWYLRSGSLALLGLPAEAERLAQRALEQLPESVALRFLQSLTRLSLGDLNGARAALASATDRRPADVLLQVQEALLVARQGDRMGAERLMRAATAQSPDHSAVAWGRLMLRQAQRDGDRRFEDPADGPGAFLRTGNRFVTPPGTENIGADVNASERVGGESWTPSGDLLGDSLRRLGTALSILTRGETVAEARSMLMSLSAGGSLASTTPSPRAFAARAVLSALIDALSDSGARSTPLGSESIDPARLGAESPGKTLQATMRALVSAMQQGRTQDIDGILQRASGTVENSSLALLRAFSDGEFDRSTGTHSGVVDGKVYESENPALRNAENANALPLRLGLSLLPPNEGVRRHDAWSDVAVRGTSYADPAVTWAASGIVAGWNHRSNEKLPSARFMAILLGAIAAMALYNAHPGIAVAGFAGALWAWSRRAKTREGERSASRDTRG